MSLELTGTQFNFTFNEHSIAASTSRYSNFINAFLYVSDKLVYSNTYNKAEVRGMSDTQVITKAAQDFLKSYTGTDKYGMLLKQNYSKIKLINKQINFETEFCGIKSTLTITVNRTAYLIKYVNGKFNDIISIEINASNYTEAVDKIRFYFKELSDYNQLFGEHVNELERNEYIDYSS